jgi:hypothetical protein
MKKFTLLAVFFTIFFSLGFYGISNGQAILYEDFNYTPPAYIGGSGSAGSTSNNWTTHSGSGGTIDILSGNLSYTGLAASNGYKVYLFSNANATSRDVNRAFTSTATVLYYSALINIIDATQILSATSDYFMHFGATSGTTVSVFGGRLGIKSVNSAANYRLSIQNTSSGTPTFTEFAQDLNFGTTYLIVVKYDRSTNPTTASLWVNPSSLGGSEPSGSVTNNSGTGSFAQFASICLRNNATTPKAEIDEIRIGAAWADVTPAGGPSAPTVQAQNITFSGISTTGMTANWTNGDGAKRIVIMNTTNSFTNPVDGSDPVANTTYGGSGEQVVYNGTGSSVSATSLTGSTTYWFRVYEYNGTGATTKYLTTTATLNPNSQATSAAATAPLVSLPVSSTKTNTTAVLGGTITSDGGSAITERGTVWKTSTGVAITDNKLAEGGTTVAAFTHTRSSLPAKTQIYFKAYATNLVGTTLTGEDSFFTLANEPTTHVTGFTAIPGGTTSINLSWTAAATGADGYLILMKTGAAAPTGIPADATGYSIGNTLGDGTVAALVTPGTLLAYTITGLSPASQYSFTIIPYAWDGANGATYNYYAAPVIPSASATTTGTGPATYTWQGADNGLWTTSTNWNPTRYIPATTDILQFNDGTAKTITGVITETIGKFIMAGNTTINLQSAAAATLTISGVAGTDLDIPAGCALNLNAVNAITLAIATTATASISGNIKFSSTAATAHRLTGADPASVTFNSGSIFTAGTFFSGNPFGTTSLGSIIFSSGSTFIQQAGSNPFGAGQPNSVVVFQTGSLFKVIANLTPAFSGRTYANFEMDATGVTLTPTGGNPVSMDNLTITNGTLNFNVTGPTSGIHQIHGNILVAAGGILNFSPASAGTVTMNGTASQSISGPGPITGSTNSTIEIANSNGVGLNTNVTINGQVKLTNGLLSLGSGNLVLGTAATITGTPSAAAMIVATGTGQLQKGFATGFTGSFLYPVGDNTGTPEYSPVTLNFASGTFAAGNYAGVNLVNAKYPTDPNTGSYLKRYWNLTQNGITGFSCTPTFQYVTADVNGTEGQILCTQVDPTPYVAYGLADGTLHQLTATGLTSFGTYTGTQPPPSVVTLAATGIGATLATLNGTVNANTLSTAVSFEYGLNTSYGTVVAGSPASVTGTTPASVSAAITGLAPNTTYHFRVKGVNSSGSSDGADLTFTTGCPLASPAGTVTGPANVCLTGTGYVYTVPVIANATTYNWTVPAGAVITTGANTNTITVSFPTGAVSGNVSVYGSSVCGNGLPSPNLAVTVNPLPVPTISGPATVCINSAGNVYTTQTGMTGYTWTISTGGTITAGSTTNSITVTWTTAGTKTVTVNYVNGNGCTAATPAAYTVNVSALPIPTITGPNVVCSSSTGVIYTTEAGMTNYAWTVSIGGTILSGQGTNTVTVAWPYAGNRTLSVNYTNPSGCSATAPTIFNVTINPAAIPVIGSSNTPCINSTNNQYYTNGGMLNYVWAISTGGTIVSGQGTNTINVTWSGVGAQWVSVTYTNTYGCTPPAPTVYNLFVNPLPNAAGAITGTATVCAGTSSVAYSCAEILNAVTYTWTLPTGATIASGAGTKNITVDFGAAATSGNITVAGTNSCGSGTISQPFAVTVNPLPAAAGIITGPASVCAGSTGVAYSVPAITGATSYVWTVPTGATITSGGNTKNIVVAFSTATGSGVITVKGTNTCGSGTVSPDLNVTINAIPDAPVVTALGNVLTSSAPNGNQWYYEGTPIAGATGQTYTVTNNTGFYWCMVTLNGCSSLISNKVWVVVTGQQELQNSNINVFPVPNDGRFTVTITSPIPEAYTIRVYDQLGSTIYDSGEVQVSGTFENQIDLRPAPNGVYSVVFLSTDHKVVRKILINK